MLLTGRLVLIGTEPYKSSKTGKEYLRVAMAQGADTVDFMTSDFEIAKAQPYKEYSCTFSYNPKYKRLDLESMKSVEEK